jgi:lipid-A-disaccharide synthase
MPNNYKIMLVAGEASGDAHAAELVSALRRESPETDFEFFGATGAKMREAGVKIVINSDELAIVGLPEIARALPMFWKTFQTLKQAAADRKPDVVILIDFPDFNLKLAKALHKTGLKTIYYISPQLWAWRKYRKKTIEKYVDLLLAILPFEKDWYEKQGISHVEYVGNPLAGEVRATLTREQFREKYKLDYSKPLVALLPGSRHKEIVRILPAMLSTAALMAEKNADLQFVVALASERRLVEVQAMIEQAKTEKTKLPDVLLTICGETRDALNAADAAAVTSGTATLETAIIGTPMAIVYKTSGFNYKTLRPLISVPHFGLINLIAQQRLAVELIQDDFTKENLSAELFRLLEPENNLQVREKLKKVVETLGGGASERAAQAVLNYLQNKN